MTYVTTANITDRRTRIEGLDLEGGTEGVTPDLNKRVDRRPGKITDRV